MSSEQNDIYYKGILVDNHECDPISIGEKKTNILDFTDHVLFSQKANPGKSFEIRFHLQFPVCYQNETCDDIRTNEILINVIGSSDEISFRRDMDIGNKTYKNKCNSPFL